MLHPIETDEAPPAPGPRGLKFVGPAYGWKREAALRPANVEE